MDCKVEKEKKPKCEKDRRKECNDKLRITTITRGKRTRTDVAKQGKLTQ
jgi:hypothetical protein